MDGAKLPKQKPLEGPVNTQNFLGKECQNVHIVECHTVQMDFQCTSCQNEGPKQDTCQFKTVAPSSITSTFLMQNIALQRFN